VMLEEVISYLSPQDDSKILDLTFGAGGHSSRILESNTSCNVVGVDQDHTAIAIADKLSQKYGGRLTPVHCKFSNLLAKCKALGIQEKNFTGVVLDAGCSSMQFDFAERGFSISRDGPLDMRMNNKEGITAADVVNNLPWNDLSTIFAKYGDEKHCVKIAQCIVENRPIHTTHQLVEVIERAFSSNIVMASKDMLGRRRHIATKTFMALRIFVNDEMNELHAGVKAAEKLLKPGGRLAVLTYHSLEDRIVKRILAQIHLSKPFNLSLSRTKGESYSNSNDTQERIWTDRKKYFPSEQEIVRNPRARSACLRVATLL